MMYWETLGLQLSPSTYSIGLASCTISLIFIYIIYQRIFAPLANVPGPFWASLSRVWLALETTKGRSHELYPALHQKYGPLVRTAPNEVSIADPLAMRKIYGSASGFEKSEWYSVWQGRRVFDLFGGRDEKIHGQQRSLVSHVYSAKSIQELEPYIDSAMAHFMECLRSMDTKYVDLGKWMQYFAFDVIGEVTFSKRFGLMDTGDVDGSLVTIKNAVASGSWLGQLPWLYWLDDFLSPIFGHRAACQARHGKMRAFAVREIGARQARGSDHDDILNKLLKIHKTKPHEFDQAGVASMVSSNIFAGSDTTASIARAMVYFLLKNPAYKMRLEHEIEEAYSAGKLSRLAQVAEVEQLPFFTACMQEAIRMHPQPGLTMPRVVPRDGLDVNGHYIPHKTVVGCTPWVIHKDKQVFGADADRFNPERWLGNENLNMSRHILTFGRGSRLCIGKNLAESEIKKVVATMFLNFHMELANPEEEWTIVAYWFALQENFRITLRHKQLPPRS